MSTPSSDQPPAAPLSYAQALHMQLAWDAQRLSAVIPPPALWSELLPPTAAMVGLPALLVGALMVPWLQLVAAMVLLAVALPGGFVLLILYVQCVCSIVRTLRYGREPIRIDADRTALRIACPGQWGPAVRLWQGAEIRRVEVYDMPLPFTSRRIIYLRVWATDYFHMQELHFTSRDKDLAARLDDALHQALALPRPGTARLPAAP